MVTTEMIRDLREKTGAGIMDCKKALTESDGDLEQAIVYLREKGLSSAAKRSSRIAAEGVVASYIHMGGKIGVLVEVNCETDFVAKNVDFTAFVKDLAMHIAASNPIYLSREDVSDEFLASEKDILMAQAINEGKPENIAERIVEGRIGKLYEEVCLLEQPFVKDTSMTVAAKLNELIATIGENIVVRRFTRYQMGEGLEKKKDSFAEEIASQIQQN
ncbi:MAG: translation elongation factor Ts [Eubacteriaceae bacterium]|nr:translation elongation factor Ts [Eubacteriaceae bacterium]